MSPEEIESLLAGLPVRTFAPEVEARMIAAALAAHSRARHWWQRSVPLWQAAAAALLVAATAGLATHGRGPGPQSPDATQVRMVGPTHVSDDAMVTATRSNSPYALDIRRWQVLAATTQGEPQ
jgi:hypothetical protein